MFVNCCKHFCIQVGFNRGKWDAAEDESPNPGYMLPLLLLSHCFGLFLATSAESAFYEQQRPLEFSELYKADDTGLLGLLKYALWQVRAVETLPCCRDPAVFFPRVLLVLRGEHTELQVEFGVKTLECRATAI